MPQAAIADINYFVMPSFQDPYREMAKLHSITPGQYKIAVIGNLHVGVIGSDDHNAIDWLKNHFQAVRDAFVNNEEQIGRDIEALKNSFVAVEPDANRHLVASYVTRRLNTLTNGQVFHFEMSGQYAVVQR